MTTERRGLFVFRTDDTGTKCAAECPWIGGIMDDRCELYDLRVVRGKRHSVCTDAESAAREAEVDALQRGYDLRGDAFGVRRDLDAEIERIRGGRS